MQYVIGMAGGDVGQRGRALQWRGCRQSGAEVEEQKEQGRRAAAGDESQTWLKGRSPSHPQVEPLCKRLVCLRGQLCTTVHCCSIGGLQCPDKAHKVIDKAHKVISAVKSSIHMVHQLIYRHPPSSCNLPAFAPTQLYVHSYTTISKPWCGCIGTPQAPFHLRGDYPRISQNPICIYEAEKH